MLGLRNLPTNKLSTAYTVVSAAMVVFALALAPADRTSVTTFVIWIVGALVLTGVWIAVGFEVARCLFGGNGRNEHEGG